MTYRFSGTSTSFHIFADFIGKNSDCILLTFKFIHFFKKYLLSAYSIPKIVLGARDTGWIRDLCLNGLEAYWEIAIIKK